jgi:hypothetical protein
MWEPGLSRDRRGTRRKTCEHGVTGRPHTLGLLPLRARSRDKPRSYSGSTATLKIYAVGSGEAFDTAKLFSE